MSITVCQRSPVAPQVFLDTSTEHAEIMAHLDQFYKDGDPPILPLPDGVHFIYARDLYQRQLVTCHNYILSTDGKRVWSRYRLKLGLHKPRDVMGGPSGMSATQPGGVPRVSLYWDRLPQFGADAVTWPRSVSLAQLVVRGTQKNPDWSFYTDVKHLDDDRQNNCKENLAFSTRLSHRGRKVVPQVSAIIGGTQKSRRIGG